MTPANLAAMCALAGLEVVALTDHNTTGNCAAFCRAAQRYGLLALPGMELCTQEEIHVLCFFETLDHAAAFSTYVQDRLPTLPNDARIFGRQLYMDDRDTLLGEEPRLLSGAADIPILAVSTLVRAHGGVACPAHIDRPSFSLLHALGGWDPDLDFHLAELSSSCPPGLAERCPSLRGVTAITGSDAHYLHQVQEAQHHMALPTRSASAVLSWLSDSDCEFII